jgi:hypothetical protein
VNFASNGDQADRRALDLIDARKNRVTADRYRFTIDLELLARAVQADEVFHAASGTSSQTVST